MEPCMLPLVRVVFFPEEIWGGEGSAGHFVRPMTIMSVSCLWPPYSSAPGSLGTLGWAIFLGRGRPVSIVREIGRVSSGREQVRVVRGAQDLGWSPGARSRGRKLRFRPGEQRDLGGVSTN